MATIAFMLDHEEGHLLPTFKLARRLVDRGHNVYYMGLADGGDFIRRQGFDFIPILEHVFPKGTMRTLRDNWWASGNGAPRPQDLVNSDDTGEVPLYESYLGALVRGETLEGVIRAVQPDLILLNSFLGANALVMHYRYRIPIVLLTPFLRSFTKAQCAAGIEGALLRLRSGADEFFTLVRRADPSARRFSDISVHFMRMPELIQCPQELELPQPEHAREQEVYYVEASVDLDRRDGRDFPFDRIDPAKRVLYCSLGSQGYMAGQSTVTNFLRTVAEVMSRQPDWQLILSTGGLLQPSDFPSLPDDAIVSSWTPQLQLLEHASLMITHGGLGTTKECIFRGVPMVVFPITRDQPENANRIVHHRLGLSGDLSDFTGEGILSLVQQVDGSEEMRRNVQKMQRRFLEVEESGIGVRLIEETLRRHSRPVPQAPMARQEVRAY